MGRPREHDEQTRRTLLAVAGDLLASEGSAGVSVRRVSQEAGTTTRAVYSLFGDKEGLLRALYQQAAETMRHHHEAVPEDEDPLVEITALALAYRAAALEEPNLYGLFMSGAVPGFRPVGEDARLARRSLARVVQAVQRFVDTGKLPGRDPRAVAQQLWGLVHGLAALELQGHLGPPGQAEARWRDAVLAAVTGYRQPPSTPQ
ncbi:TetR/AcrR family transcriptional regulator [Nonomuraea turkmeniaca]|uniref:TetR/AcrR family transcriptional regulator n=1 Tax=Nonomuraea turkmeniaca TaxID=103838 RepID=A0A5S4FC58_9ACTN|nr:TetR/AcrR family transcriptional regulator [Nonomuraea turkmeniaca]TMR15450.1 TetR/AcrR family transcriptional regulator [Nonomuraea turkmeniaca]